MSRTKPLQPDQALVYHIRLKGRLGPQWREWFEGSNLTLEAETTLLTCPVTDEAALYGLLRKVRDLGIPLLSVTRVAPEAIEKKEHNDDRHDT